MIFNGIEYDLSIEYRLLFPEMKEPSNETKTEWLKYHSKLVPVLYSVIIQQLRFYFPKEMSPKVS